MASGRGGANGSRMKVTNNRVVDPATEEAAGKCRLVKAYPLDSRRHGLFQVSQGSVLILRLGSPPKGGGKGCDHTAGECQHPFVDALAGH